MITMSLGWGAIAALLAWSAFVFWLGRNSAAVDSRNLSSPPASFGAARPAPRSGYAPLEPAPLPPEQLPPKTLAAIRSEIARGNKINAIKLLREATGLNLMQSKNAVEAMGG